MLGASELGIKAAKKLNYEVIVIENKGKELDRYITSEVESVYLSNINDSIETIELIKLIQETHGQPSLIISFTELGLETAAIASEYFNLKSNPITTIRNTRNKICMRKILNQYKELALSFWHGTINEIPDLTNIKMNLVVKPSDGYGSKNIYYINDQLSWENWKKENINNINTNWIIEPYINGSEYSVESVSSNGVHYIIGITEKDTTGVPNFIEVGHSVPAKISKLKAKLIHDYTIKALDALKFEFGAGHLEFKWDNSKNKPVLIEAHTRTGGDRIPYLHYLTSGLDQYTLAIESLSKALHYKTPVTSSYACIRFIQTTSGLLKGIQINQPIKDSVIEFKSNYKIGDYVPKLQDSLSRFGHVIFWNKDFKKLNETKKDFMNGIHISYF
ncbi:ATP-grasp domain-containing protein [Salipaludibacillus sp. LMS25]|jgi:biotin carboxylase|uniref:ATP-grasp domain-containing protein n=1 Tax=Salipaludibacillus sp. LMS25 TaxID=2924031 RepID=UPI0020D195BE|nr:ATP-grasp domain-containing protein [Salipaludibacillus sp. LMS25]UTR15957.1 ATP-grasp domain-containing protein [Salipaludibacillus sp. LMS25]